MMFTPPGWTYSPQEVPTLLLEKPPHDLTALGIEKHKEEFPFHHPIESLLNLL